MENQGKTDGQETLTQEEQENQAGAGEVNQPGGEQEEKLFAGVFKTQEELEQGYVNSNKEATRMAQEIKRLNAQLQQAKTPEKKEAIQDKIDDLEKYFDKDTAKILSTWTKQQIADAIKADRETSRKDTDFQGQVSDSWKETVKLFPDVADPKSKIYVRANEILFERGLAEVDENGVLRLLTPFAYRMAVEAAATELGRQATESAGTQVKKGQAGMVQGRGSKGFGGGKLSYEQYMKLPDDEKDAYDAQQRGK